MMQSGDLKSCRSLPHLFYKVKEIIKTSSKANEDSFWTVGFYKLPAVITADATIQVMDSYRWYCVTDAEISC
jgi:hypothetical protein